MRNFANRPNPPAGVPGVWFNEALSSVFTVRSMRKVPLAESLKIIGRGSMNWIAERPIVV
jgi:hypothetical protein